MWLSNRTVEHDVLIVLVAHIEGLHVRTRETPRSTIVLSDACTAASVLVALVPRGCACVRSLPIPQHVTGGVPLNRLTAVGGREMIAGALGRSAESAGGSVGTR